MPSILQKLLATSNKHKWLLAAAIISVVFIATALIFRGGIPALSSKDGSLNVLLLGVAGEGHVGAQLTDTIIFANINPQKNEIVLVSIPRDLYLSSLKAKINALYALREEESKGEGLSYIKTIISEILNRKIDYVVKVDFAGFTQAVDLVGGLDIEVENSFEDPAYPIAGREDDLCEVSQQQAQVLLNQPIPLWQAFSCRFEKISFNKGRQHMDGATALKFVRSRNAPGDEGTDFARSKRQQKIMIAFQNKLLKTTTLLNPTRVLGLYNIISANIETDVPVAGFDDMIRLAQKMKGVKARSLVLDEPFLINPPITQYGLWVLMPKAGADNFSEIQQYIKCEIESGNCQNLN